MRSFGRIASVAVTLISIASMAGAADIRVLSVGAVQHAVKELATEFANETGHKVILTFASPVVVTQKIKDGESFDAVIVSEPAMDRLDKEGVVNPESRVPLAKTGMGVAVRAGAPLPDLSTPEAFKQSLLAAKSVVHGDPTLPNQSGEKAERILVQAGILDALKPRLKMVPGQARQRRSGDGLVQRERNLGGQGAGIRWSGAGTAAGYDELRGRADVGRRGAGSGTRFHPLSREP